MSAWSTQDIPDQTGRVFVVTGANAGLGLEVVRALMAKNAYVVLAVRDTARGDAALAAAHATKGPAGGGEVRRLDLASLASVREFAAGLAGWRIDVLVNNAGIMNTPRGTTEDGFEQQFGVNVLGHFLLTDLLLPQITDRVVWVSSMAHRSARLDVTDLDFTRRPYSPFGAYAQSKLADLMLAYELERRFVRAGDTRRSVAAHPGMSATNLFKAGRTWMSRSAQALIDRKLLLPGADAGALPLLYAATVADLPGGAYIGPAGWRELSGTPIPVGSSAASHDAGVAAALWDECARRVGVGSAGGPG